MSSDTEVVFEVFEFEADAWTYLYDNGFIARLADHRQFDHPDGRWAVLIPGDDESPETEVKIFAAHGPR